MGIFDKINNALTGKQGDGHTTSGLDAAMQAHANEVHPVQSQTVIGKSDKKFPAEVKKPHGGWALHLPSDDQ